MSTSKTTNRYRDNGTFDKINSFVTLKDNETKKNVALLKEVTDSMIDLLKNKDDLFKSISERIMYTGSYYKGTKIGKPEEFDWDLIIKLPVNYDKIQIMDVNDRPGFARIIIEDDIKLPAWRQKHEKTLNQWLDEGIYLNHGKIRRWFEGIVSKCFGNLDFDSENKMYLLPSIENPSVKYNVKTIKSGPAFTLIVKYKNIKFTVDLVLALEFNKNPSSIITKKYSNENICWHLIPKPSRVGNKADLNWRYCFSTDERTILKKNGTYKPVIRQMKKLRDTQNWGSIFPSYFIETLFFHQFVLEECKTLYPWCTNSYIDAFIFMLKEFRDVCKNKRLNYFWVKNHNLLDDANWEQVYNIGNRLETIIKDVELEPSKIAEYVLTKQEFTQLNKSTNQN